MSAFGNSLYLASDGGEDKADGDIIEIKFQGVV